MQESCPKTCESLTYVLIVLRETAKRCKAPLLAAGAASHQRCYLSRGCDTATQLCYHAHRSALEAHMRPRSLTCVPAPRDGAAPHIRSATQHMGIHAYGHWTCIHQARCSWRCWCEGIPSACVGRHGISQEVELLHRCQVRKPAGLCSPTVALAAEFE